MRRFAAFPTYAPLPLVGERGKGSQKPYLAFRLPDMPSLMPNATANDASQACMRCDK
ncbi:hypothetical protein AGMMS50256_12330 [Betaproteobacteria bacterium]|nr:hypothetical protein AGMMS50256_12330 [Betaproteobacteria bacterium]